MMGLKKPFVHLGKAIGVALFAAASACESAGDPDTSPTAANTTAAAPRFIEMRKADILRSAMGCLHPPPYPLDNGPICLRSNGSWIRYSGWGQAAGNFRIVGNTVFMHGPPDAVIAGEPDSVAFFRDREGTMFISDDPLDSDRPLRRFNPYPEAEYLGEVTR